MRQTLLIATALLAFLAGCLEEGTEIPVEVQVGPPESWSQPPAKGVCRLLVGGLMPPDGLLPGGAPLLQGNDCHFDDVLPGNFSEAAFVLVNVTWDSLQPTLTGRVQATVEHAGCDAATDCQLVRGAATRTGPILLEVEGPLLHEHAGQDLVVRIYPEGHSFQQAFTVQLVAEWTDGAGDGV